MSMRSVIAVLLTIGMLVFSSTACADEPTPAGIGPVGDVPTAKKVTMYSLLGLGVVAYGLALVSFAQLESARSEHDRFPDKFGMYKDCLTPAQCKELSSVRGKEEVWGSLALGGAMVGIAALLSAGAVQVLWPHQSRAKKSARLTPAVTPSGASLGLEGIF